MSTQKALLNGTDDEVNEFIEKDIVELLTKGEILEEKD